MYEKKPGKAKHAARIYGVIRWDGKWRSVHHTERGKPKFLGDFDSIHRAVMARKLYHYWMSAGYSEAEVPRKSSVRGFLAGEGRGSWGTKLRG